MKHNDHRRESDTSGAMGFGGSVAEAGGVMEEKAAFIMRHGSNTTDRMVPDLMEAIISCLEINGIKIGDKSVRVKRLGAGVTASPDGETRLLFDVLDPDDTFDHIEFKITKTGWGRSA